MRGAIKEECPVWLSEDQSFDLWLAIICPPGWHGGGVQSAIKSAWWRYHLTLNRMTRQEIQLKLSQLCHSLSNVFSCIRVVEHDLQRVGSNH
jgi:hypothetical protein